MVNWFAADVTPQVRRGDEVVFRGDGAHLGIASNNLDVIELLRLMSTLKRSVLENKSPNTVDVPVSVDVPLDTTMLSSRSNGSVLHRTQAMQHTE